jgi:hypothetical protein
VQLPVTVLMSRFAQNRVTGESIVNIRWHPNATARPIRASSEMRFDNTITGYASAAIDGLESILPTPDGQGLLHGILWDDQHQTILAATGGIAFIRSVGVNTHVPDPEPRVFTVKDGSGGEKEIRIGLANTTEHTVKAPAPDRGESWIGRRIFRDEAARLAEARRFVQYNPPPGQQDAEHDKALRDIRALLNEHGRHGAWLWDPYLSAEDVIHTLFHCHHKNADLRGLTSGHEPLGSRPKPTLRSLGRQFVEWIRCHSSLLAPPPKPTFADGQRAAFEATNSNFRGLTLEFRMKSGETGWAFHDRFLIFPKPGTGALAWSLGTSVNSLGRQHHIFQQVDDGEFVAEAFRVLWDQLDQRDHLIWKAPG